MKIISHRGWWKDIEEKNSEKAFRRSFANGFGTETDIRDHNGRLIISHDIPIGTQNFLLDEFLELYNEYDKSLPLALNIKSDGLSEDLSCTLARYNIDNYFLFDASVPDAIQGKKNGLTTYTRYSEFEITPAFERIADGLWMDCFENAIIPVDTIKLFAEKHKNICLVSPELHGRDHLDAWKAYKVLEDESSTVELMICTDLPELAKDFFND